jgi:hypothetical protein
MGKFTIQPHGRLQEWIGDEKGDFRDEGLEYEFSHGLSAASEKKIDPRWGGRSPPAHSSRTAGRRQQGREIRYFLRMSLGQPASAHTGRMGNLRDAGGIMVPPPRSCGRRPRGRKSVGYHSGSHFTTIQAVEPFPTSAQASSNSWARFWGRVDVAN